jgi:acyl carrier protein
MTGGRRMDVRTRIAGYLGKAIAEEIRDDDDIFELGVVSSLFAIQLVAFVENEFSITVEREDLDINNFCSIAALTKFVHGKLA